MAGGVVAVARVPGSARVAEPVAVVVTNLPCLAWKKGQVGHAPPKAQPSYSGRKYGRMSSSI
jgi:hypothetical protein